MRILLIILVLDQVASWVSVSAQVYIKFSPDRLKMSMDNSSRVDYTIFINTTALPSTQPPGTEKRIVLVEFRPVTLSPQFDIIEFNSTNSTNPQTLRLDLEELRSSNYVFNSSIRLRSTYIGHARLELKSYLLNQASNSETNESLMTTSDHGNFLEITVVKNEGILDKIFMYSVIIFITISYINLGAQIDTNNAKRLIETPKIIFLGFLIGVAVMPTASWIAGHLFFQDQPMLRIGSFVYACGPAASASVLWTVMFDSDKELSLGLQIASTIGALFTMPILLYAMDKSIDLEGQYTIKVPYMNLGRTLLVLLVALMIGNRLVSWSKRAKRLSPRIFRPLTMSVLLLIIVFSSIVYWYIYRMFSWYITAMALIVTSATYIFSGLLGYIINKDFDQMITISISSTYRNSGIAFAALIVAFQPPDVFIAYVPCLTQVVATSLIGLVLYSIKSLKLYLSNKSKRVSCDDIEK